jgi:hypothetical protein
MMIAMAMMGYSFGLIAFVLVCATARRVQRLEDKLERLQRGGRSRPDAIG